MKAQSLRTRLIVIILTPLLVIATAAATWQFRNTTIRAEDIFDRGLLSAALAISRDVAISDGDALGPITRQLITDTSGGEVFYHVYAPDGVFVTGYATPPAAPSGSPITLEAPLYYDALYQGRDVRVLRFQDAGTVDGITGLFTVTVWQDMAVRASFIRDVVLRTIAVLALLLVSVGLVVWFGVGLGLRPLLDLQAAIARRTPSDLDPIRRPVPAEAQGIVSTLNALLDRVSRRISSKDEFISNAAHQLRNPIAGVLALAEAVENAPTPADAKLRSTELVKAARDATHLTNQLLSFERAKGTEGHDRHERVDLVAIARGAIERLQQQADAAGVQLDLGPPDQAAPYTGDAVMLQEAVLNLLTNALLHGGSEVSKISVWIEPSGNGYCMRITDDGIGIAPGDEIAAMSRFSQPSPGTGSGLGIPIAARVLENHGGRLTLERSEVGTHFKLSFPT